MSRLRGWPRHGRLAELLGDSPTIEVVRDKLRRLLERQRAGQRLPPILIQGETGTGKGLVARLLHRHGARSRGPFVDVNCAAIPETLLEAELFGFERGAFTDARRAKPGLFQAAHGGVLFLDEIGAAARVRCRPSSSRSIEERAVRRLGSTRPEPVDVWVISATNTDLQAAVRARRFRDDLYHRLAVITIDLPPLRERGRDILLLAERFLARACADYGLSPKTPGRRRPQARLLAYAWPGNIRELGNVIERAALFADTAVVTGACWTRCRRTGGSSGRGARREPAPSRPDEAMRHQLLAAAGARAGGTSRTRRHGWASPATPSMRAWRSTACAAIARPSAARRPAPARGRRGPRRRGRTAMGAAQDHAAARRAPSRTASMAGHRRAERWKASSPRCRASAAAWRR